MSCNHEWGGVVIPGPVNRVVIDQCENCGELRLPDAARQPVTVKESDYVDVPDIFESARQPGAQVPKGWKLVPIKITDEMENAALRQGCYELGEDGQSVFVDGSREEQWDAMLSAVPAPPAQGIDLGQLWEPIKEAVHTALSVHVSAMSQKKREQVAVYVARQLRDCQRDAAPGVGDGN